MKLTEAGELRIRGYLFVLHRSLASFRPKEVAHDSLREVESHIRERVARIEDTADEKSALEAVLAHLGPPMKVAQAYAAEITFEEAVATGRPWPVLRALWYVSTSFQGFLASLGLLVGYAMGLGFLIVAFLKPVFPQNVGLFLRDGVPVALGAMFPVPPGLDLVGGYALVPLSLLAGGVMLLLTHRMAGTFLAWWRSRAKGPTDVS
jgi:hypothetical protein